MENCNSDWIVITCNQGNKEYIIKVNELFYFFRKKGFKSKKVEVKGPRRSNKKTIGM